MLAEISLVAVAVVCQAQSQAAPMAAEVSAGQAIEETAPSAPQERSVGGEAAALFKRAAELIEQERCSAAIPLLRQAAGLAPNEGRIHHFLAYALMKLSQQDAAKAEFEKALELEPGNIYTEYFLARILYSEGQVEQAIRLYEAIIASGTPIYDTCQRLGQAYARKGEFTKALEMIQQAIQQTPWDGALHYLLARIYSQMGRKKEAHQEFETGERLKQTDQSSIQKLLELSEAVRLNERDKLFKLREELLNQSGSDPEILTWLGALLGRGGFHAEALQPLQQATAIKPDSFEACYNLGLTLVRLGREREAETHLKEALDLRPESFEVNSLLAVAYVNQGRNRDAIERLRAARQVRPGNFSLLALLGQQYLQGWYLQEAIETLSEALRLKPDDSNIRYLLIEAYQNNKEYNRAMQVAEDTRKLFPNEGRSHYEVGHQMANLGHYQKARPYFEEAIRLDPSFAAAYNWMGDLQLRGGEYKAALQSYQKSRSLDSTNLDAARGIGRSLIRLKHYPQALEELEELIATHPDDAELHLQLSQVYGRLGNSKEAAQANVTFERLHAMEVEKRDNQRPRVFAP